MMNEWIISSSILIVAVLLGRQALRGKISLRLQYALWLVVLLRLLLPVQIFTSSYGAGSIARDVDVAEPVRQVYAAAREDAYEREYDAAYQRVMAEYEARNQVYVPADMEQEAAAQARQSMELDLTKLLYTIWFAGMGVMTAVIVLCNAHFTIQLKRRRWAVPETDSLLPVYVTEVVPTPCLFGLFHPAIYLTAEAASDEQVRRHVLSHELTHYRHLDHIWSVLRTVCLILHWYNPLVWLAVKVSRADAELACDEGTLAKLGEEHRADYGRTLIGLTCGGKPGSAFITATTMTGSARTITERIRLLMKRPRNTVLALTALILIGSMVVGCSFAGAPETTEPTETTAPGVDNDMSYQGQDLPIPDDPTTSDFITADGLLVFPGTEWGMTEAELLEALDIQEYGLFSGLRGFLLPNTTFCGYPASVSFYFCRYREEDEWGLCNVTVQLQDEDAANVVYSILYEQLGRFDAQASGVAYSAWWSDAKLEELIAPEAYAVYQETLEYPSENEEAASILWYGSSPSDNPENAVIFRSGFALARQIEASLGTDQAAEVAALFGEGADTWYLSALTVLYPAPYDFDAQVFFCSGQTSVALTEQEKAVIAQAYGKEALEKPIFRMTEERMDEILQQYIGIGAWDVDLSGFLFCPETGAYLKVQDSVGDLPVPEIISCEVLAENQVRMIYTLPGREQRYAATLLKGENWKVYSNQMVISKPLAAGTRALTEAEIEQVGDAFQPVIEDEALGESYANPLACMVNDFYDDVTQMDRSAFLRNFPYGEAGTEEDFQLLKKKYPDFFDGWTWENMPIPVHRYEAEDMNKVLQTYADIRWEDLAWDDDLHYLEETGCFYNYTSDFGLMGFHCTGGWIYDGGATLCSNDSVLILTERNGEYFIQAHLPALASEG